MKIVRAEAKEEIESNGTPASPPTHPSPLPHPLFPLSPPPYPPSISVQGRLNRPRSIYQYCNMAPTFSVQNCKFVKFLFSPQFPN